MPRAAHLWLCSVLSPGDVIHDVKEKVAGDDVESDGYDSTPDRARSACGPQSEDSDDSDAEQEAVDKASPKRKGGETSEKNSKVPAGKKAKGGKGQYNPDKAGVAPGDKSRPWNFRTDVPRMMAIISEDPAKFIDRHKNLNRAQKDAKDYRGYFEGAAQKFNDPM